jgi:hypothetical protein
MPLSLKSIPAGVTLSPDEVNRIAARSTELLTAFQARIDNLRKQVADALDRLQKESDELVRDATPENRATATQYAKHALQSKFAKFKNNIVSASHASRQELLQPLATHAENAKFLLGLFSSPAQALSRVGLGETRRTNLQAQITGAGPVELESYAAQAITANDVLLAAALVTVIDRMPSKERPFSVNEFATIMWGKQHAEVVAQLQTAIQANKLAQIAEAEFRTGEVNEVSRLSASLSQRDLDKARAAAGNEA